MKIVKFILILYTLGFLLSCRTGKKEWKYASTIDLDKATPIGLTIIDDHLWVADGDNNQLLHLDKTGKLLFSEDGFERPMHITTDGKYIYVPEYGKDQITIFQGDVRRSLKLPDNLDAPAGIHYADGKFAIADFYNHRILFGHDKEWISFGKEGKADGEFYYPTDVHISHDKIYVADAYNNRVQVFDYKGGHLLTIGKNEKMNAATGIYVSADQIFITDFENNRVLVYDLDGNLTQEISSGLDKPTDIYLHGDLLYISNYGGKNLMVFKTIQ